MPLQIGLASDRPGALLPAGPAVSFWDGNDDDDDDDDNGAYYWFLHPFFQRLAEKTGQYIDLYGDAEFRGDDVQLLRQTLLEAREVVAAQPERWSVHVGTQTMPNLAVPPPPRKVFKEVERSTFLSLFDSLLGVVDRSVQTGLPVVCYGD